MRDRVQPSREHSLCINRATTHAAKCLGRVHEPFVTHVPKQGTKVFDHQDFVGLVDVSLNFGHREWGIPYNQTIRGDPDGWTPVQ